MRYVGVHPHDFFGTWFFWFPDFAQSPGFAGLLAVVAAVVAYVASTRNARKERWWKRAEYALDLTLSKDESEQQTGLEMLDALASRNPEEQAFIAAAIHWFLQSRVAPEPEQASEPATPPETTPPRRGVRAAIRGIFRRTGR